MVVRQFCCFNGLPFSIHLSLQILFKMNYALIKFLLVIRVNMFAICLFVA